MKLKIFTIFIFTMGINIFVNGQTNSNSKQDSIKKKEIINITVYDKGDVFKPTNLDIKKSKRNYLIKFNPFAITRGELPIYFERKISDYSGIEIGLGPTIEDLLTEFIRDQRTEATLSDIYRPQYITFYEEFDSKIGYMFRLSLRIYPKKPGYAISDFYIAPVFSYKTYRYEVPLATLDGYSNTVNKISNINSAEFAFIIGKQNLERKSRYGYEYFGGFGYKMGIGNEVYFQRIRNSSGDVTDFKFVDVKNKYNTFYIILGMKFGIGF